MCVYTLPKTSLVGQILPWATDRPPLETMYLQVWWLLHYQRSERITPLWTEDVLQPLRPIKHFITSRSSQTCRVTKLKAGPGDTGFSLDSDSVNVAVYRCLFQGRHHCELSVYWSVCACLCVQALDLLGLKPTEAQRQTLRSRLRADPAGTVAFTGKTATLNFTLKSSSFTLKWKTSKTLSFAFLTLSVPKLPYVLHVVLSVSFMRFSSAHVRFQPSLTSDS